MNPFATNWDAVSAVAESVAALASTGALVVALWLAWSAYQDRHVEQARLVWSEVGVAVGRSKDSPPSPLSQKLFPTGTTQVGATTDILKAVEVEGEERLVYRQDMSLILVTVNNNSAEPIGNVAIALMDAHGAKLHYAPTTFRVIPPSTTRDAVVYASIKYERRVQRRVRCHLRFTDSAGRRWVRVGMKPPTRQRRPSSGDSAPRILLRRARAAIRRRS